MILNNHQKVQYMQRAAELLRYVRESLDVGYDECEGCHGRRYHNFRERNWLPQIDAMQRKLEQFANELIANGDVGVSA